MNTNLLYAGVLLGLTLTSCANDKQGATNVVTADATTEKESLNPCEVKIGGITFTRAKNGAQNGVSVMGDTLKFVAGPQTDYFCSPTGSVINNSPVIFTEIDNTRPFTFTAKVEPEFTPTGTYSAGVIYAYEDQTHCQKICFEQDEYGDHRVVTVRTIGTSDDNNHQAIPGSSVYLRFSSDGTQLGTYFSEDGKIWRMARLYKNDFPEKLLIGLSSQSPKDDKHTCYFTEVSLVNEATSDFRNGKLAE